MSVIVGSTTGTVFKSDTVKLPTSSSPPLNPERGDAYFDTAAAKVKIFDGFDWVNQN